ncbi:MAG: TIGR02996 domain-containing protein [Planctomycetes bacterium]|nr:TIGR02996 domain-containing protein [Planctomycetota bacterium]
MDEREALLAAIWAAPEEDTPRLVYADWLQEHGDDARAEFIRVQIRLAGMTEHDTEWSELITQERELLDNHRVDWLGDWAHAQWLFRRGFPDSLKLNSRAVSEGDLLALAESPDLATLTLGDGGIGDEGIAILVCSPHLATLTTINLGYNGIGNEGATALAVCPHLTNLTTLTLSRNAIRGEGAAALASSPHLVKLRTLNLNNNSLRDAGVAALAASSHLTNLAALYLENNSISNVGALALASSPHLRKLALLNLRINSIDVNGAIALAESTQLTNLMMLKLGRNRIRSYEWSDLEAQFENRVKR